MSGCNDGTRGHAYSNGSGFTYITLNTGGGWPDVQKDEPVP